MRERPPSDPSLEERTVPRPAERVDTAPRLEIVVEREAGREGGARAVLLDGDLVRVGSHPANDLVVTDPAVSRFHLRLTRELRGWRLRDMGSTNGTRVLGMGIRDADLPHGEALIEIGDSRVRVRERASERSVPVSEHSRYGAIFGGSASMRKLFAIMDRVAPSHANVLIEGESGTGKELVAAELVKRSARVDRPFVVVDCSAIPANLIESTLFGHVRGAFTGAERDRVGAFEAANGGTVFLDELGELPLEMQPKLLRVIEAQRVQRIGENRPREIDVRVVAATNRMLDREMNAGRFREDLYFRLAVVTLRLPALRERLEDLELLVAALLTSMDALHAQPRFTPEVLAEMRRHDWPGNVRELRNYVERVVVLERPEPLASSASGAAPAAGPADGVDLEVPFTEAKETLVQRFERRYIAELLRWADGNVTKAARKAKVDRIHLHRLITRHDLKPARSFRE